MWTNMLWLLIILLYKWLNVCCRFIRIDLYSFLNIPDGYIVNSQSSAFMERWCLPGQGSCHLDVAGCGMKSCGWWDHHAESRDRNIERRYNSEEHCSSVIFVEFQCVWTRDCADLVHLIPFFRVRFTWFHQICGTILWDFLGHAVFSTPQLRVLAFNT